MRTRRASLGRWMTLGVAAVALVGQLAGLAHLVLVPHVACPEHGEWVEATASHSATSAEVGRVPARPAPDGTSLERPGASPAPLGHSHDHCIVSSTRRSTACPSGSWLSLDAHAWVGDLARTSEPSSRASVIPLLSVAPKSSPPVA